MLRLGVDRFLSHQPQQLPAHSLAIDRMTVLAQPGRHFQHAVKWRSCVLLIEQAHEEQVLGALPSRFVVETRAGKPDQLALAADADRIIVRLDQSPLPISRAAQLFF